jgi:hypothetical protein
MPSTRVQHRGRPVRWRGHFAQRFERWLRQCWRARKVVVQARHHRLQTSRAVSEVDAFVTETCKSKPTVCDGLREHQPARRRVARGTGSSSTLLVDQPCSRGSRSQEASTSSLPRSSWRGPEYLALPALFVERSPGARFAGLFWPLLFLGVEDPCSQRELTSKLSPFARDPPPPWGCPSPRPQRRPPRRHSTGRC